MNNVFIAASLIFSTYISYAQKPAVDTASINQWETCSATMSSDGNFFILRIFSGDMGSISNHHERHCIAKSADGKWQKIIGADATFASNSSNIFWTEGNCLWLLPAGTEKKRCLAPKVSSFEILTAGQNEWVLAYSGKERDSLNIFDLKTGKHFGLDDVKQYWFNHQHAMIIEKACLDTAVKERSLQWVDLLTGGLNDIWHDDNWQIVDRGFFSLQGEAFAFFAQKKGDKKKTSIWLFTHEKKLERLMEDYAPGADTTLVIDRNTDLKFNSEQSFLLCKLMQRQPDQPTTVSSPVGIWSYKNATLPTSFSYPSPSRSYATAIRIATKKFVILDNDSVNLSFGFDQQASVSNYWLMIQKRNASGWSAGENNNFIVSIKDGSKTLLDEKCSWSRFFFSPSGKELIGFDKKSNTYSHLYEIESKTSRSIEIPGIRFIDTAERLNDQTILFYDQYRDIWLYDITSQTANNITNGFGRKKNIRFTIFNEESRFETHKGSKSKIYLLAFEQETKRSGFYTIDLDNFKKDPEKLFMDECLYSAEESVNTEGTGMLPEKARLGDQWMLIRQTATEAPNYFTTSDFKHFRQITFENPQSKNNWLTSTLIHWKSLAGENLQGVLYKPEDFDSTKRYPVIFLYYEEYSDQLNLFLSPQVSHDALNIPWFVSRGYLVFVPDIKYEIGHPGSSAFNSIAPAAELLKKMPWVDGKKMGLQGHSFGGYETNYIVTHSQIFSAAVESAGATDLISKYFGGLKDGNAGQDMEYYATGQGRMGSKTFFENKTGFIDESPIFNADKIETPLLMVHNKKDPLVLWTQAIELFTALWRLGKPAWLLQYDNGEHGLLVDADSYDYNTRMMQFFNHYLKNAPPPKWMTSMVPVSENSLPNSVELDRGGSCSDSCRICNAKNY